MRILWHVIGMLVFGIAALALPAWLAVLRMGQPVDVPAPVVAREVESTGPLDRLTVPERVWSGMQMSIRAARFHFNNGKRSEAMHALDAALRVAALGTRALPSQKPQFQDTHRRLKQARREIQNGHPALALHTLDSMIERWSGGFAGLTMDGAKHADGPAYKGAVVMDVYGARIGDVVRVDNRRMTIAIGGVRDVFGFLNLSPGNRVEVPVSQVLGGTLDPVKGAKVMLVTWSAKR
jgi:hypothetical protein